jgi:hypothetical protein
MQNSLRGAHAGLLLGMLVLALAACNGEPHDGYYDRDHHRWYHEHGWRECGERDPHCR